MQHILRLLLICLIIIAPAQSVAATEGNISREQAINIARHYIQLPPSPQRKPRTTTSTTRTTQPYYLFNDVRGNGYVIIAGDKALGTILARSKTTKLDTLHAPEALKWLLNAYRESYEQLQRLSPAEYRKRLSSRVAIRSYHAVQPMLRSRWSQGYPYNSLLDGYEYAGCVATAMAQVMYYHRWPEQGKGSHSYKVNYDGKNLSADFSNSRYEWDKMRNSYPAYGVNTQEANAIGKLLYDIGVAVNMQYSPQGSGARESDALTAFKNYFSYNVGYAVKASEGTDGFLNMLSSELQNGYPVLITGTPGLGKVGHAMVVDGITEKGEVHINFGWGGQADGFFDLSAITTSQSGSEFGGKPLQFGKQLMGILAHPDKPGELPIPAAWRQETTRLAFNLDASLRLRSAAKTTGAAADGLDVQMSNFINPNGTFNGDIGLAITNEAGSILQLFKFSDNKEKKWFTQVHGQLVDGQLWNKEVAFHLSLQHLQDGTYHIIPMSATRQSDGKLGEWVTLMKSPRMVFNIEGAQYHVTEENYFGAGYRAIGALTVQKALRPGEAGILSLPLRCLDAVGAPFNIRLEILDKHNTPLQTYISEIIESLDGFSQKNIPLTITTDENIRAGKYNARITIEPTNGTSPTVLKPYDGSPDFTIQIEEQMIQPILRLSGFGLSDGTGDLIQQSNVNVAHGVYQIIGYVRVLKQAFSGKLFFYWKDKNTGELRPVGYEPTITIAQGGSIAIPNRNMMADKFNIINGHTYQLVAAYEDAGQKIFIPVEDGNEPEYTITGSKYQEEEKDNTYQPKEGDFVRIRLASASKYLTAPGREEPTDTRLFFTNGTIDGNTLPTPESIFRYIDNGLVNLATGRSVLEASASGDLIQGLQISTTYALPTVLKIKGNKGKHTIEWNSGGQKVIASNIIVEKVNRLPIQIGKDGICTFHTPVNAVLSGAQAYGGIPSGSTLKLIKISDHLAAGTAFILQGPANTWCTLQLPETGTFAPVPSAKNALVGTNSAQQPMAGSHIFALSAHSGTFLRLNTWLRPFRAYLNLTGSGALTIDGLTLTGIEKIKQVLHHHIVDLYGRTLSHPSSGQLYIRDGKKMIAR